MSGHGWVTPNPDGSKAKCGGPAICKACALEAAEKRGEYQTLIPTFALRWLLNDRDDIDPRLQQLMRTTGGADVWVDVPTVRLGPTTPARGSDV